MNEQTAATPGFQMLDDALEPLRGNVLSEQFVQAIWSGVNVAVRGAYAEGLKDGGESCEESG